MVNRAGWNLMGNDQNDSTGPQFEKTMTMQMICALHEDMGEMTLSELIQNCGNNASAVINRMLELKISGYVIEEYDDKPAGQWKITLTEKGENAAKKIMDIEEILFGEKKKEFTQVDWTWYMNRYVDLDNCLDTIKKQMDPRPELIVFENNMDDALDVLKKRAVELKKITDELQTI